MEFPAFRSEEWVTETYKLQDSTEADGSARSQPPFFVPKQVLSGVALTPKWMVSYRAVHQFKSRQKAVQEEIRRALFRQALFKVQNIEVMSLKRCPSHRILLGVQPVENAVNFPFLRPKEVSLLREELWWIQRCESVRKYTIRYYQEGENGYSCRVFPRSLIDWIYYFRYSYTSPPQEFTLDEKAKT